MMELLPLLFAPFVGSFLGVLIVRLPRHVPVVFARSACPACGTRLSPRDLIPLVSFALQRGRCRHCGHAIGWFHPAVEVSATAVSAWAVLASDAPYEAWASCVLGWTLLTLAWIDAETFTLPDALTMPLILLGLAVTTMFAPDDLLWHALGAACGYLSLRIVAVLYCRFRGREGLGIGDAKLLAGAGAWLGLQALPWVILLAALAALAFAGIAAARGRAINAATPLPFGPFLAVAMWLLWLYGVGWELT